jgi:hypothetical protein
MEAKDKQLQMKSKSPKTEKPTEKSSETTSSKKIIIEEVDSLESKKSKDTQSGRQEAATPDGEAQPVGKRIKSYDYASWEKFDVDKALVRRFPS